MYRIIPVP